MTDLKTRYSEILERVRAASPAGSATVLIAVSKTVPIDQIEALYRLGHRDFGENYVQELVGKAVDAVARGLSEIRWHFIGHLQSNKVKQLVPIVHAVHSVDSLKLGQELARRWSAGGRTGRLPIFIEVNIDDEPDKAGVSRSDARGLTRELTTLPELDLRGFMCVPRPREASEITELRARFASLRELEQECRDLGTQGGLSMGMSGDFEVALVEGATHIRVGTALFGARSPKPTTAAP